MPDGGGDVIISFTYGNWFDAAFREAAAGSGLYLLRPPAIFPKPVFWTVMHHKHCQEEMGVFGRRNILLPRPNLDQAITR
jgi:hypothetical protein